MLIMQPETTFPLGVIVITNSVDAWISMGPENHTAVTTALHRHCKKDWGDMDPEDKKANDKGLETGQDRVHSAFKNQGKDDKTIWIITEYDGSVTTILFPEEY